MNGRSRRIAGARPWLVLAASALLGLTLIADEAVQLSATYDEVTYLRVGARWWRTGEQQAISRMGTPITFWKLQQAPVLWLVDRAGHGAWVDDPIEHQADLLPWIRIGGAWTWLAAFGVTAGWARARHGDRAMALAALMFALGPNLLAHGALATMEMPLVAASVLMLATFDRFLRTGRRADLLGTAAFAGLAFACKFTAVLFPPILAALWAVDRWLGRDRGASPGRALVGVARAVVPGMIEFAAVFLLADLCVTGFALMPFSPRSGDHPTLHRLGPMLGVYAGKLLEASIPQDWVGFGNQLLYQRAGGPSYLLGERRTTGWWYYYPITLLVKVPLGAWILLGARGLHWPLTGAEPDALTSASPSLTPRRSWLIPAFVGVFLLMAVVGSKRNYGVRYLLPLAPPAIVWASALANATGGLRWARRAGLAAMAVALAAIHPYELAYFNSLAGGPEGGRRILADSNLDWGQGALALARLQRERPEFRDLTWYAFGDTDPRHYGVVGRIYQIDAHRPPGDMPADVAAETEFLAVSASLQWGPWGPEGYFRRLDRVRPVRLTADKTVAIYRTADLDAPRRNATSGCP